MATKFTPKKNKVTGTKKKDKITWVSSKAWKKALTVNAGSGNDVINFKKSKYKNKLNGQNGNDTVYGGTKNDTIHGNAGADKLYGYNGADKIYGDDSSDKIYGGNGNDYLYAGKGNDYIDGGNNNDKIYGQYGTNTLKGGAGNDSIYAGTGTDKIWGGSGNDVIDLAKGGTNTVYGEAGTDKIVNIKGNAVVDGGADKDTITAISGNNTLKGGDGNDSITSGTGNDFIEGGDGDDTIVATVGSNTITGGAGNDHLYSGTDANLFIFDGNFGNDTIYNATSNDNILIPSAGLGTNRLRAYKSGDDIVIHSLDLDSNSITIKDWFTSEDKYYIGNIPISIEDSGTLNLSDFNENLLLTGGESNITPNSGTDNINMANTGNNTLNLHYNSIPTTTGLSGYTSTDTINFSGDIEFADLRVEVSGTNLLIKYGEDVPGEQVESTLTIYNYLSNLTPLKIKTSDGEKTVNKFLEDKGLVILDGSEPTTLTGGRNNVILTESANITGSSEGNDTISAGIGNDTITVNGGNDNEINAGNGNNVVNIAAGSAYVTVGEGNDSITIGGDGESTVIIDKGQNTVTVTSDCNTINDGSGKDTITVSGSNNSINLAGSNEVTITGGNNLITGVTGDNTINLNSTAGNTVSIYGGENIINGSTGNDTIKITNQFDNGTTTVSMEGGSNVITTSGGNDVISIAGDGNNNISTSTGDDNITLTGNGNNEIDAGSGDDSVVAGGGDDIINMGSAGTNGDTVYSGAGDDEITIYRGEAYGEDGDDSINATGGGFIDGGAGNDTISTGWMPSTVTGGTGNDELNIGSGSNSVYLQFNKNGDANDTVNTDYSNSYNIQFTGFEGTEEEIEASKADFFANKLWYEAKDNDLIIRYATESGNSVTLKDFFKEENISKINNLRYTDYQYLYGDLAQKGIKLVNSTDGDDNLTPDNYPEEVYSGGNSRTVAKLVTIEGGLGNDTINCHANKSSVYLSGGEGNDSITGNISFSTIIGGAGNDTLIDSEDTVSGYPRYYYKFDINTEENDVIEIKNSDIQRFIYFTDGTPNKTNDNLVSKDFIDNSVRIEQYPNNVCVIKYGENRTITLNNCTEEDIRSLIFYYKYEGNNYWEDNEQRTIYVFATDNNDTINANNYQLIDTGAGNDTIIRTKYIDSYSSAMPPTVLLDEGGDEDYIWLPDAVSENGVKGIIDGDDILIGYWSNYTSAASPICLKDYVITDNPNILKVKYGQTGENYVNIFDIVTNKIKYSESNSDIEGTKFNDSISSQYYTDVENITINALGGNDTIILPNGTSTVNGGTGNDSIEAHSGSSNLYEFASGDGTDTITGIDNIDNNIKGQDTIFLTDATVDSVTFDYQKSTNFYSAYDLIINYGNSDDKIIINKYWISYIEGNATYYSLNGYDADIIIKDYNGDTISPVDKFIMEYNQSSVAMNQYTRDKYFKVKYNLVEGVNNSITGGQGDETVTGGGTVNTINMYNGGTKYINVSSTERSSIYTGNGNDTIITTGGDDSISAGDGDDSITVNTGDDRIEAGAGNDYIYAGTGKNVVWAGEGNDTIWAGYGGGTDQIDCGTGVNEIHIGTNTPTTGNAAAMIWTYSDGDTLVLPSYTANTGNIKYDLSGIQMSILYKTIGGTGYNVIQMETLFKELYDFNLQIPGATAPTSIYELIANATDDQLAGITKSQIEYVTATSEKEINCDSGSDYKKLVIGSSSNQIIKTSVNTTTNNPSIVGGAGNDSITVESTYSSSRFYISGGEGKDTIYIENGIANVHGGSGDDAIDICGYSSGTTGKYIYGDDGNDTIKVWGGYDNEYAANESAYVYGGEGNDYIDFKLATGKQRLYGEDGNDNIYGGQNYATIEGGDGNDTISSAAAKGKLDGGAGDDVIYAYRISNSKNSASIDNTGVRDTSYTYGDFTETINGGEGNDTIYAIGENVEITDYYGINQFAVGLTNNVKIKTAKIDKDNIENTVRVRQPNQNALLVFDINASSDTDSITYSDSGTGLLWITNDVSLESWVNTGSFNGNATGTRYGAIQLANSSNKAEDNSCKIIAYYGTGSYDYKQISRTAILQMQQEVASWLSDNDYSSVNEILTGTDTQAKSDLIAKFTDVNTRYWYDMNQ